MCESIDSSISPTASRSPYLAELLSPSDLRRRFLADGDSGSSNSSESRFFTVRCLAPGFLSGPRRLGTESYLQSEHDRREQLWQMGFAPSHRILRVRLQNVNQLRLVSSALEENKRD